MKRYDELWSEILSQFGEDNMKELIRLIHGLDELYENFSK